MLKEDSDWRVRRCVAEAIGDRRPSKYALIYLGYGLVDSHWKVQFWSIRSIFHILRSLIAAREIDIQQANQTLVGLELLASNAADPRIRSAAKECLEYFRRSIAPR